MIITNNNDFIYHEYDLKEYFNSLGIDIEEVREMLIPKEDENDLGDYYEQMMNLYYEHLHGLMTDVLSVVDNLRNKKGTKDKLANDLCNMIDYWDV